MKLAYKLCGNRIIEQYTWELAELENLKVVDYLEHRSLYIEEKLVMGFNEQLLIKNFSGELNLKHAYFYSGEPYYLNFQQTTGLNKLKLGDVLHLNQQVRIEWKTKQTVEIMSTNKITDDLIGEKKIEARYQAEPIYTSAPRAIQIPKAEQINLELPPEKEKKSRLSDILLKLVPLGIGLVLAWLMLKLRPTGARGMIMLLSIVLSSSVSVITLWLDRKRARKFNYERKIFYEAYLQEKREQINAIKQAEVAVYEYNSLSLEAIHQELSKYPHRLFEREIGERGFLCTRIGLSNQKPEYQISIPESKLELDKDGLKLELEQLAKDYQMLDNVPYSIDLYNENVGLIGEHDLVLKQLKQMLCTLVFNHSYHDLELVMLINEHDINTLGMFKYVKHLNNGSNEWKNIVTKETNRELILNTYLQILRLRDQETKEQSLFVPHIVFVITNYSLIASHPIMEFLTKDHKKLGFSLLICTKEIEVLPKQIQTAIHFQNSDDARLILKENVKTDRNIYLQEWSLTKHELECDLRKIGQLKHIKGITSVIPENLGFLEMYEVENPKQLEINSRWQKRQSLNTLAALIGKKSDTDYIYLDVHEKAHGPHGLIAGTTGSGKSEFIQTLILSLAINYSPEEIGFLLIDYKGGGMANQYQKLPHLLGTISNLDGYLANRALASIKSELVMRQEIFTENRVNHITDYQKLFFSDVVNKPLPHLFIISDEFAELKREQPEFMKELVSVARIGRSLGIHLILATQKPSGVVDEQIWSNTKFKVSLKLADEADSRELLKTNDAAYLVNVGRAYLKVGNNEIYELFQSAYSAKPYISAKEERRDYKIYKSALNNQKTLINYNPMVEDQAKLEHELTELDVILEEILISYQQNDFQDVSRPWQEALAETIVSPIKINCLKDLCHSLKFEFGVIDIPHHQLQIPLKHNLLEDGYLLILGSTMTGKTTALLTICLHLAASNSPELMKFYIIDLGNGGLLSLKNLHHTGEYLNMENELDINRLCKLLLNEINERKQSFATKNVTTISAYNQISSAPFQSIVLVIDNFGNFKDMDNQIYERLSIIMRDGLSLGIYVIISASRTNDIKSAILSQFNRKIILFTNDRGEINYLVGKSEYPLQEIPGRGLIKIDKAEVCQLTIPFDNQDEIIYRSRIEDLVTIINKQTNGIKNTGLVYMPSEVSTEIIEQNPSECAVGLDYELLETVNLPSEQIYVIEGDLRSGKTNLLQLIIEQVKANYKIALFDNLIGNLSYYDVDERVTYVKHLNDFVLDHDVFIFNHLDFINKFERKEQEAFLDSLYYEFLKGKKFIFEVDEPIKIRHDLGKHLQKPQVVIILKDINQQTYLRIRDTDLKKEEYVKYDAYLVHEGIITRFKPAHFKQSKGVNHGKSVINMLDSVNYFGGVIFPVSDFLIVGRDANKFLLELNKHFLASKIKTQVVDLQTLLNDVTIDNLKLNTEVCLFADFPKIQNFAYEDRKKVLKNISNLNEEVKVIISCEEQFLGIEPFVKKYKALQQIIFTQSPSEQNVLRVMNREVKNYVLDANEALFVDGTKYKKLSFTKEINEF